MSFSFVSSGNSEQDEEEARRIRLSMERRERGICPNGCAPMVLQNAHFRECPKCNFGEGSNVPFPQAASLN